MYWEDALNWATRAAAVLLLVLWQLSERTERKALEIAATTVQTTAACVAHYGASAEQIGVAVHDLTNAMADE